MYMKKLTDELTRALLEAKDDGKVVEEGAESFNELVNELTSKGKDLKAFAFKTKATVNKNYSFTVFALASCSL